MILEEEGGYNPSAQLTMWIKGRLQVEKLEIKESEEDLFSFEF